MKQLKKEMHSAAAQLDFEGAIRLRDEIKQPNGYGLSVERWANQKSGYTVCMMTDAERFGTDSTKVRVDKWLWATRKFKTRTLAGKTCDTGHVKINGNVAKASSKVKVGDEVKTLTPGGAKILKVLALLKSVVLHLLQ